MNNGTISEILVRQNDTSVRAFDHNGAVHRAEDLKSYTPIVFHDIQANVENKFSFGEEIDKPYEILAIEVNSYLNHQEPIKNIVDDKPDFNSILGFSTYKNGVLKNQRLVTSNSGKTQEYNMFISPQEQFAIHANHDFKSVTFWCRPCHIQAEIAPRKLS